MYRVVLIDDEIMALRGMAGSVPWGELGMEIAGTARDGAAGIALVKSREPDIVITDIRMPGMDGLDMIREILNLRPQTICIIMSGYSEFQYAKAAIAYGVMGYLEKPVDVEELKSVLQKAREILRQRKKQENDSLAYSGQELSNLLKKALRGEAAEESAFLSFGIDVERLKGASVAVCGASGDTVLTERTLWQARETLRECGRTAGRTQLLLDQGRLILLMPGYEGKKEEERLVEAFRRTMSAKGCCPLKIGVCRNESAARPLQETYQNACYALRFCIFYGTGPCLFYRQNLRDQAVDLWSVKEAVTAGMAEGRTEAVPGLIRDAIDAMTAGQTGLERFVHECMELLYCCVDALDPLLRTRVKQTILETENPFGVISGFTHVEEARTYLLEIFGKIADLCQEDVNRDYHYKIAKAQDYILKHYQESITLQQLADLVEMSPTYFSALFKKTVGVTYLQYLTEVRMEQARRRLLAGEKVTKISEEVGYYNYRHFSEAFKRHVGMTPREFRNNRKNTDNI